MAADPIVDYIITDHAAREMRRRRLGRQAIDTVLQNPAQRLDVRSGRVVLQSIIKEGEAEYLLRVVVDIDRKPAEVVTVYRTSKVVKYWRNEP